MVYQLKQYTWADGFKPKVKADIVGGVVEQIISRDGKVTKESFLEESRPKNSPTHALFEWDNKKAAEAYRLEQARLTISQLRLTYEDSKGEDKTIRAYVNTEEKKGQASYENVFVALVDENKKEVIFDRMKKELENFIERNKGIEGLYELLIDEAEKLKEV